MEQLELVLVEFRLVFQLRDNIVSHQGDQEYKVDAVDAKYLLPKAQVKLMRDLPFEGLLPPMGIAAFRFIPPRTVHHQMGHHHQREQVVDMLFNLRKMDGY